MLTTCLRAMPEKSPNSLVGLFLSVLALSPPSPDSRQLPDSITPVKAASLDTERLNLRVKSVRKSVFVQLMHEENDRRRGPPPQQ